MKDKDGAVSEEKSAIFRKGYHSFLTILRSVYPNITILAVAAYPEWIQKNVKQIVDEEQQNGNKDIYYTHFDDFPDGKVAYGHPTVESHKKIADQIIKAMDQLKIFSDKK